MSRKTERHPAKTPTAPGPKTAPAAVRVAAPPAPAARWPSPHLLDLKASWPSAPAKAPSAERPRQRPFYLQQLLDEHWHLHDLRMRTLSIRPRGWKDFPPASAKTVPHAFALTIAKFFREHPLAELTVLTVVHLFVVAVWRMITWPIRVLTAPRPRQRRPAAVPILPIMPLLAVPAGIPAAAAPTAPAPAMHRSPGWLRRCASFALAALVFILPLGLWNVYGSLRAEKNAIMDQSLQGVSSLRAAGAAAKDRKFGDASGDFQAAYQDFNAARDKMGPVGSFLVSAAAALPFRSQLTAAGPLLTAGREIAAGGQALSDGLTMLDGAGDPTAKIAELKEHFDSSLPHLNQAVAALDRVSTDALPESYRATLAAAKDQLPTLAAGVDRAAAIADLLGAAMGAAEKKRYLVVFENNAELRPTGGFIGSFALVDVERGQVKKVDIPGGGSYDLKGGLSVRLASPQPLQLINPDWQFQDANWFPDFPTSARKISWFYEKSGGPTTDGVIAITMSLMEKILEVTGPIDMPDYGKTITAGNFYFETQKAVELDYDRTENKPKKFVADLAPKVLQRLLSADREEALKLIDVFDSAMAGKQILFWFRDPVLQAKNSALGWDGAVKPTDGDYLEIVHTNIAGQKTDLVMKDDVDHAVKVLPDGTGIATLTIKRTHTGEKNALFSGVRNVDYLRVYVPYGSVLIEASGFSPPDPKLFKIPSPDRGSDPEVAATEDDSTLDPASGVLTSTESGKTVFGNWVQTDPGQTSIITLVYKLPPGTIRLKTLEDGGLNALYDLVAGRSAGRGLAYSLLLQKQPGANPAAFASHIDFPRGFNVIWQSPPRTEDDRGRWSVSATLDQDRLFGAVARSY